jgi:hypothetical protein
MANNRNNKSPYGTWVCDICGQVFETKHLLYKHKHELNHFVVRKAWNKGHTQETDERVKIGSTKLRHRYEIGELTGSFLGRHHSSQTKQKMREKALQSNHQRVCKKTFSYTKPDGTIVRMDSTYESRVAQILDKSGIDWIRPKPLQWIDRCGTTHHYFPDFFIPHKNIYLDPKNEYCFVAQSEKIQCLNEQYNNIVFLHEYELTQENILRLCE